jgi:hypothetical protein
MRMRVGSPAPQESTEQAESRRVGCRTSFRRAQIKWQQEAREIIGGLGARRLDIIGLSAKVYLNLTRQKQRFVTGQDSNAAR